MKLPWKREYKMKARLIKREFKPQIVLDYESTKKGTTVASSIGDDTLIGSVCERSEAEDGKVPEIVDGDPIGLNIEDGNLCVMWVDKFDGSAFLKNSLKRIERSHK